MNTIIVLTLSGTILTLFVIFYLFDKFVITRIANNIKVGDKKRIFNSDETNFEIVEIKEIFKNEKGIKIAKCEYENGTIGEIPIDLLIY